MRLRLASAVVTVLTVALPAAGQAAGFHEPESPLERRLDTILKRVDRDNQAIDNLVGGRGSDFKRSFDYRAVMTAPLLAAIAAHEKAAVKKNCAGRYRDGEVCGLDYNPITCAQDSNPTYLYATESEGPDRAEVTLRWPYSKASTATLRLVREGGEWKLDGVRCPEADSFNMK